MRFWGLVGAWLWAVVVPEGFDPPSVSLLEPAGKERASNEQEAGKKTSCAVGAESEEVMSEAIKVTVTDPESGEVLGERVIENGYILVCAGSAALASTQTYANGTHVLTVKGRRDRPCVSAFECVVRDATVELFRLAPYAPSRSGGR